MVIIQDKFISDEIFETHFLCNLSSCKGACCWEGDFGAPLTNQEKEILIENIDVIKKFLGPASIQRIKEIGLFQFFDEPKFFGTALHENGSCVYLTYDEMGVAQCGIEKAWEAGEIDFQKPISCHLYPIRVTENEETRFSALNYDKWEICNAACALGKEKQLPLFRFVKKAIMRKYGVDFYNEMEAYYQNTQEAAAQ